MTLERTLRREDLPAELAGPLPSRMNIFHVLLQPRLHAKQLIADLADKPHALVEVPKVILEVGPVRKALAAALAVVRLAFVDLEHVLVQVFLGLKFLVAKKAWEIGRIRCSFIGFPIWNHNIWRFLLFSNSSSPFLGHSSLI